MTTPTDKSPRSFWIYAFKKTGGVIDCRRSPTPVRFDPELDEEIHVIEASAYLAVKQELVVKRIDYDALNNSNRKLAEANARIVEFEDIKRGHLKVQEKLQQELEDVCNLLNEIYSDCEIADTEGMTCSNAEKVREFFSKRNKENE